MLGTSLGHELFSAYQVQGVSLRSLYKRSTGHVTFTIDPVRDLLIWAVIQNHRELAGIIWAQVPGSAQLQYLDWWSESGTHFLQQITAHICAVWLRSLTQRGLECPEVVNKNVGGKIILKDLFIYFTYVGTLSLSSDTPEEGIGFHYRW